MLKRFDVRLTLIIIAMTTMLVVILTIFNTIQTRRLLLDFTIESQRQLIASKVQQIEDYILLRQLDALVITHETSVHQWANREAPLEAAVEMLNNHLQLNQEIYQGICLLDAGGNELSCLESLDGGISSLPEEQLENRAGESYFTEAIAAISDPGESIPVYMFDPQVNPHAGASDTQLMILATWLESVPGEIAGMLILKIKLEPLINLLADDLTAPFAIIDSDGGYIAAHNASLDRISSFIDDSPLSIQDILLQQTGTYLDEEHQLLQIFSEIRPPGQDRMQWILISDIPLSTIQEPAYTASRNSFFMSGITLLIITALSLAISRIFTLSLSRLIDLVDYIQNDNKPAPKKIHGSAIEITILENALNSLNIRVKNLLDIEKKRVQELETSRSLLSKSESQYRQMLEMAREGIWALDLEGNTVFANQQMANMLGYEMEQLKELKFYHFLDDNEVIAAKQYREQRITGLSQQYDFRFIHKDGHHIHVIISASPLYDEHDNVYGTLGFITDITERIEAQQRLEGREQRYKIVSDLMSDYAAYVRVDADGELHNGWMIGAYTEILGYDIPGSDGHINLERFIHPQDYPRVEEAIKQVLANKPATTIYRANHKAGHYIWLEVTRTPIWSEEEGRVTGFYSAAQNVSDRMQAQLQLQESERRYKRVSGLMSDYAFYIRIDADGKLYNGWRTGAHAEILGFDPPEAGLLLNLESFVHPDDFPQIEQSIQRVLNNEIITETYRSKHAAGHYIWVEVTRQPVWDEEQQRVSGYYGAARDVSDRMEAQLRLQESELRYRQVSELMTDYTFATRVNLDGTQEREWVAGAFEEILGYTIEETGTNTTAGKIHPDDLKIREQSIARVLNNEAVTNTYRTQHKAGHYIWLEVSRRPVWGEELGRVTHYYGAARNVTDRMEAQLHLQESESRFRTMANTAPILIWMSNTESQRIYFNDVWLKFTGRSMQEELAYGWIQGIHPDDYEHVLQTCAAGHKSRTIITMEYQLRRHDGEYRLIRADGVPLFLDNGEFAGFIGTSIDITAQRATRLELERLVAKQTRDLQEEISLRKEVEIQLTRERNLLQSTMKTSPTAIFVLSDDGSVKFANDATQPLLEDLQKIAGKYDNNPLAGILDMDGNAFAEGESPLEKVMQSGETLYYQDVTYKNIHMIRHTISLNLAPLHSADGQISEVVITARDITVEREIENRMKAALQEEMQLNQIRSRFIATITHEFKTPLSVIKTSCDMARLGHKKMSMEQILERFDRIEEQGKRLNMLVDDVVKLNRTNNTDYHVLREKIELPETIRRVTEDILTAYLDKTEVEYDFQPEQHHANLDTTLTHQILSNLIGNAVKYSDEGGKVRITSIINNEQLEITIKDEGIGIPAEDMPYLFGDFFRASNTALIEGTGLGLAIAKRAIELQEGTISVESVEHEGTTFHIILPLRDAYNL